MNNHDGEISTLGMVIGSRQRLFREGLAAMFRSAGFLHAWEVDTPEVVWSVQQRNADILLLDMEARTEETLDMARLIDGQRSHCRTLLLDDRVRPAHLCAALGVAAKGYWTKEDPFSELSRAVRQIAAGRLSFCPAARHLLAMTPQGPRFRPRENTPGTAAGLTRRELEVLALLSEGLTVKQCAERLRLAASTVDNHKVRLMRKLNVHKVVDLVRLAVREGLVGT